MILNVFLRQLHGLIHGTADVLLWKLNEMLFIPVVNVDTHKYISESFGTENWDTRKRKEKNMNSMYCR